MTRRVRVLLLACGITVIVVLIVRTGPALLAEMLRRVGWNVVTIVLFYAAHVGLRAWAMWRVFVHHRVHFFDVLRVRFAAEAVEVLTYTGPFLAEPAKGWLLTQRGLPLVDALAAVAIEYLLYTTMSALLALVAFTLLIANAMVPAIARIPALATAVAMAAFIGAVAFAACSGIGLIVPIIRASGAIVGRTRAAQAAGVFEPIERLLVAFLHHQPARLLEVIAIEALSHACLIAEIWIVLTAMGVSFFMRDLFVIEGGTKLISVAFFFIPGQVGVTEAVYGSLLRVVGLAASIGLTLALLRRVRSLCVAGAGVLVASWFGDR